MERYVVYAVYDVTDVLSTCQIKNTGDSEKPYLKAPPPAARLLSYLSSTQQDLTGEPQEDIRKLIIAILALKF